MGLHTNWHKTKIQNIGTGVAPRTVHIDNQAIETVSRFTYLGSDIDSYLLVLPGSRARIVRCGGRYDPQLVKRSSEWVSVRFQKFSSFDTRAIRLVRRALADFMAETVAASLIYSPTDSYSGATTGGNGGSRLRAPMERGRRVQTAMFFLFC